jgi:hypothetical protein
MADFFLSLFEPVLMLCEVGSSLFWDVMHQRFHLHCSRMKLIVVFIATEKWCQPFHYSSDAGVKFIKCLL